MIIQQYLETGVSHEWENMSLFNYIGVSKLSYSACCTWIHVYNPASNKRF